MTIFLSKRPEHRLLRCEAPLVFYDTMKPELLFTSAVGSLQVHYLSKLLQLSGCSRTALQAALPFSRGFPCRLLWACRKVFCRVEPCLAKRMHQASITDFHAERHLSKQLGKSPSFVPAVRLRMMERILKTALLLCVSSFACPTRRVLKVRTHFGNPVAASSLGAAPQDVSFRF